MEIKLEEVGKVSVQISVVSVPLSDKKWNCVTDFDWHSVLRAEGKGEGRMRKDGKKEGEKEGEKI